MKLLDFAAGLAVGMAAATAAITGMYPSTSKKLKRDGKKLWRNISNMF